MDIRRLKNIAIIILAALNLCFAALIFMNRCDDARISGREKSELSELFAKNGIELGQNEIPQGVEAWNWTVARNLNAEAETVKKLLGEAEQEDQGGNIFYYENENGWATFRNNGEFEIYFNHLDDAKGAENTARELLGGMGMEFSTSGAVTEEHGDSRSISFVCTWNGKSVLNCCVRLTLYSGGSASISGRRLNGEPQKNGDALKLDVNTMLIGFLDDIRSSGLVCNRIEAIELCYMMGSSATENTLEPIWQIRTDGGEYRISVQTGELL